MPAAKSAWGIDVGQCALKALKLRYHDGQLEALSFDVIEHPKILSQPDADEQQLIRDALKKFLSRNDIRGSHLVIGVPGQASFSRFIKLPPVDIRKVPEIVRYEARQQIPFDLDEVIWDHQIISPPSAAPTELEVGIFAMKRDIVNDYVSDFVALHIEPDIVQMTPLALYNFFYYDKHETSGATLIVDVGCQNTNLIISDQQRVWMRNIPMGGNNFTQALCKAFNLTFGKAEDLKRHAADSKHARKLFQAMRPVFGDLLMEIQRSIGYYTSLHRESRIEHVLALGNTFRLPGLRKFLSQGLGIEVQKIQAFNSLTGKSTLSAPLFKENVLSFGTAFGLALQGLGQARISTNLIPAHIRQRKITRKKRPYFVAAAASILIALGCVAFNATVKRALLSGDQGEAERIHQTVEILIRNNESLAKDFDAKKQEALDASRQLAKLHEIIGKQDYVYDLTRAIWDTLPYDNRWPNWKPGDKPDRSQLKIVEILKISVEYRTDWKKILDIDESEFEDREIGFEGPLAGIMPPSLAKEPKGRPAVGRPKAPAKKPEVVPAMVVTIEGTTPRRGTLGRQFIHRELAAKLQDLPFTMLGGGLRMKVYGKSYSQTDLYKQVSGREVGAARRLPRIMPARRGAPGSQETDTAEKIIAVDRSQDWWFKITWVCSTKPREAGAEPAPAEPLADAR